MPPIFWTVTCVTCRPDWACPGQGQKRQLNSANKLLELNIQFPDKCLFSGPE